MVDALRYELSCELSLKRKANVQNKPILAVTPTETPVGMGALFSSGEIEKILKDKREIGRASCRERVCNDV